MPRKPTSNGAPAADTIVGVTPKVWQVLQRLAAARQTSKNRERDLCQKRKELDEELNQLGPGHTAKHLDTRSDLVITLRAIDWHRARIRSLSDKIDAILLEPNQDDLFDHLPDLESNDPDEATLFSPDGDGHGPVGEPDTDGDGGYESASAAAGEHGDSIETYLPGVFKDQNAKQVKVKDMLQLGGYAEQYGADVDIVPSISPSYGCRIDFRRGKETLGCLAYVGPVPSRGGGKRSKSGA